MKNQKVGFAKLSKEEYEFLLEKRAVAKKKGNFQIDRIVEADPLEQWYDYGGWTAAMVMEVILPSSE